MSEVKYTTKFNWSPDLCSCCNRLLSSEINEAVLLHKSVLSLSISSDSCHLCLWIFRSLTGKLSVKNGPSSLCLLETLISTEPGQPSEIWGRRLMLTYADFEIDVSLLPSENVPISLLEVMMVKTDRVGRIGVSFDIPDHGGSQSTRGGKLKDAVWGLLCDPGVVGEAEDCPYTWEYTKEGHIDGGGHRLGHVVEQDGNWVRYTGVEFLKYSSTGPRHMWWGKGIHGPYHRALVEVSSLDHRPGSDIAGIMQKLKQEAAPTSCGSVARLELAQHWMKECLERHIQCLHWRSSFAMPSRVIDVGPADGSLDPFLHIPSSSQKELYLCLSHRWGGAKVLRTLVGDGKSGPGTFLQFLKTIPIRSMPKTFRDAVKATRTLGFRYIWIDSLCIIQDDKSDWEAEAKKMGGYYRNAHLTLVAGSAVSADSGLFFPMMDPTVACRIGSVSLEFQNCRRHGLEPHEFSLFAHEPEARVFSQFNSLPKCPLDERAWVLQENVLSARSLIFTDEGLSWECVCLLANEGHPHGAQHMYVPKTGKPTAYGDEFFFDGTFRWTFAQEFKTGVMVRERKLLDSTLNPLVRALRSTMRVALDEALVEAPLARYCCLYYKHRTRLPPSSIFASLFSTETQVGRYPQTRSAEKQDQNLDQECVLRSPNSQQPTSLTITQEGPFGWEMRTMASHPFLWHQLVEDYSARHLTRESDRLIAIQGLVAMLAVVRNDQYCTGLWRKTLQDDLMWVTNDTQDANTQQVQFCSCTHVPGLERRSAPSPRRRPENNQLSVPSWSWANADQGVSFFRRPRSPEEFFRTLGVNMSDDDAVMEIRGRLTLEGVLRPVSLPVAHRMACDEEITGSICDPSDPSKTLGSWIPDRKNRLIDGVRRVICLPLGIFKYRGSAIQCLVLEPTEDCRLLDPASKKLEFRRIGMAAIEAEHRAWLGLGASGSGDINRPWDQRVGGWTKKPRVIEII